jgi:hypothetical protein
MREKANKRLLAGKGLLLVWCVAIASGLLAAQSKLAVCVPKANVHVSPDSDSPVINTLSAGDILSLFESGDTHGEWMYVSFYSQTRKTYATGFIHVSQVRIVFDNEASGDPSPERDDEGTSLVPSPESKKDVDLEYEHESEANIVRNHSLKIGAITFMPSEESFKDIYGSGIGFGGELNIGLWKSVFGWIIGNYYTAEGSLPITQETTSLSLLALGGGPKIIFSKARIRPYLGIGPVIYIYKEENPIGLAEGTGFGFIGQLGFSAQVVGGLILDASLNYTYCEVQPQNIKANVGGVQLGLSIGYSF